MLREKKTILAVTMKHFILSITGDMERLLNPNGINRC